MRYCSAQTILLSLLLISCNNIHEKELDPNFIFHSTISLDTVYSDTSVATGEFMVDDKDQLRQMQCNQPPAQYDYLDKDSYEQMIKSILMYDKMTMQMSMDSAIILYSSDLIPTDSIIKWWNCITK